MTVGSAAAKWQGYPGQWPWAFGALAITLGVERGSMGFLHPYEIAKLIKKFWFKILAHIRMQLTWQTKLGKKSIVHGSHANACLGVRQRKGRSPFGKVVRQNQDILTAICSGGQSRFQTVYLPPQCRGRPQWKLFWRHPWRPAGVLSLGTYCTLMAPDSYIFTYSQPKIQEHQLLQHSCISYMGGQWPWMAHIK